MHCDGPTAEECDVGPVAKTDLGESSSSEIIIDVTEVQQGDYVRVTLRLEKMMGMINEDA